MPTSKYIYGGTSDIGYNREVNEDYFHFAVIDDDVLLTVVADGMGSKPSTLQPAAICTMEVTQSVQRQYDYNKDAFLENPTLVLREALYCANRVMGAFKIAKEEDHAGFGCSLTAVLLYDGNKIAFAHTGNTRISLIRVAPDGAPMISQITEEHTVAMKLFYDNVITSEDYYFHPDRYRLSSCLGFEKDPEIQLYKGKLKKNDILLITTDGIHYAIKEEYMARFVLESADWNTASNTLVNAAKIQMKSENASVLPDNVTAALLFITE